MKRYQSHKIVEAAQILGYSQELGEVTIYADNANGYECIDMPNDFFKRGMPKPGDYLVRYQPDGYLSWSPKAVFEAGYTELQMTNDGKNNDADFGQFATVTIKSADGKRSMVHLSTPQGNGNFCVPEKTFQTWWLRKGQSLTIIEGQPHRTVVDPDSVL